MHAGPLVFSMPGRDRAETTVTILGLGSGERAAVLDRKRELLEKARALLEVAEKPSSDLLRHLRRDAVARMCRVDAEYSAMVQTYVAQVERQRPSSPQKSAQQQ